MFTDLFHEFFPCRLQKLPGVPSMRAKWGILRRHWRTEGILQLVIVITDNNMGEL